MLVHHQSLWKQPLLSVTFGYPMEDKIYLFDFQLYVEAEAKIPSVQRQNNSTAGQQENSNRKGMGGNKNNNK